jgi:hypothetical protein
MHKYTLWGILLLALVLRIWGSTYGFPHFVISDERPLIFGALKMMELRTLIPSLHPTEFLPLYYMPFMSYVFLVTLAPLIGIMYIFSTAPDLATFKSLLLVDPSAIWIASRIITALIGTVAVYVVYRITLLISENKIASLFAATFMALSFYHIELSHMSRHWIPAVTLAYISLWSWLGFNKFGKLRNSIYSALSAAFAFGTNPSSIVALVPSGILSLFKKPFPWSAVIIFVFMFGVVSSVLIAVHPYGLTLGEGESEVSVNLIDRFIRLFDKNISDLALYVGNYIILLFVYERMLLVLSAIGVYVLWKRERLIAIALLLFVGIYTTLMYFLTINFSRPIVMLVPALSIFAGVGLFWFWEKLVEKNQTTFKWFLIFIIFSVPLVVAMRYDMLLARDTTRHMAIEWIEENIPDGSRVLAYAPLMSFSQNKAGVEAMEEADVSSLRSRDRAIASLDESMLSSPRFAVTNMHFISHTSQAWKDVSEIKFGNSAYEYLVISYQKEMPEEIPHEIWRIANDSTLLFSVEGTLDVRDEIDTVSLQSLFYVDYLGPYIEIYKL